MEEYSYIVVMIILVVGIVSTVKGIVDKKQRDSSNYRAQNSSTSHNDIQRQVADRMERKMDDTSITVGPVIYYGNSNHNASDVEFRFKYVYKNGSWRAYIIRQPSFNGRDEALTVTHRYRDIDNNMYYVCWDTPIAQIKDMQNVSKFWADNILEYIATGKRFGHNNNIKE